MQSTEGRLGLGFGLGMLGLGLGMLGLGLGLVTLGGALRKHSLLHQKYKF